MSKQKRRKSKLPDLLICNAPVDTQNDRNSLKLGSYPTTSKQFSFREGDGRSGFKPGMHRA